MKAIYMAAADEYGLVDRPKPIPAADEALVRVVRSGLCHTDVIIRQGTAGHVKYPFIPGHEFAGTVEACGPVVKYIKPGDRVVVHQIIACGQCTSCRKGDSIGCENLSELGSKRDGGFAEYCVVPARHLLKLPDHVTFEEGAMVEPLANALSAVRHTNPRWGERVVIVGPGPIGLMALQVARLYHPAVLILAGTRDERLTAGKTLGATHMVNTTRPGAVDEIKAVLGKKGASAVVVCAGARSALELATEIIGWQGRIALEGVADAEQRVPIRSSQLLTQGSSLVGVNGWTTAEFTEALELIAAGLVKVKPLITHTFPLEQWELAFDMITERKSEAIKVMFAP